MRSRMLRLDILLLIHEGRSSAMISGVVDFNLDWTKCIARQYVDSIETQYL